MSWKSLTCVTVFCALLAGQAMAVPTISVVPTVNGDNVDWAVSFTPDPTLLAGGEGALAVEVAFEFSETLVGGVTIDPDWMETINGVQIVNPGDNPYTGAVTEGATIHTNVPSQLGGAGNINAIFAALGSTKFMSAGEQLAMTFTTMGTTGTVTYGGFIAQDEDGAFENVSGSETAGPGGPPGDTNGDGKIDLNDLFNVQNNFGLASPPAVGDTDGNGTIDLQDLFNVQNNFGLGPNDGSGALNVSAAAVPEPATVALLSLCGIGGLAVARFRRK